VRLRVAVAGLAVAALVGAPQAGAGPSGRGAGTDGRRWLVSDVPLDLAVSAAVHPFTVTEVTVPVRDGTRLDALLYEPVGVGLPAPRACVVAPEGYPPPAPGTSRARLADLARRGYAGLFVYLRGAGVPVEDGLYPSYGTDGYDIVEWAASQPWCDVVGMIGTSLNGIAVWLTAAERPPHLRAIAPEVGCGDCYWYLWYRGGTRPGAGRAGRRPPGTATDEWAAATAHPTDDAWWAARNTTTDEHRALADAGIAVLHCGGWDDYIHTGGLRAVEELTAAGGHALSLLGPCAHGASTTTATGPIDSHLLSAAWFDHWLLGRDNGVDRLGEAVVFVEGADQYRSEPTWPPADTRWTTLHLRAGPGGSATSLNDGRLLAQPPLGGETGEAYTHDPADPFNDAGGGGPRPTDDQRPDEARSLTWTTDPLPVATELTGWPRLDLWASSSAPDADVVAELTEVAPDGTSTVITRGWLNAPQALSRTEPVALVAHRLYHLPMELWPVSHVVPAGYRLRLSLAGSDAPGTGVNPFPATVTVHHDPAHPSSLTLPVIGTGDLGFAPPG